MLLKERNESEELMIMRFLNNRMEWTEKEKQHLLALEKGYEGEVKFDQLAENIQEERYILNDLLFEVNHSYFQIDTLIISQNVIHLLDIKNFEGDWYLDADKFRVAATQREYKNPIDQLKRCTILFNQLVQNFKHNYIVEAYVIFVNPEFTLYQAPMNQPIILPTQLNRFLNDFNKTPSKLNDGHKKLAQHLLSLHKTKSPFTVLPQYNFDQLKKGVACAICSSFSITVEGNKCICSDCGHIELLSMAVVRSTEELKLLLPNKKITTNIIHEWCKIVDSKKRIRKILGKHYNIIGVRRWAYYE